MPALFIFYYNSSRSTTTTTTNSKNNNNNNNLSFGSYTVCNHNLYFQSCKSTKQTNIRGVREKAQCGLVRNFRYQQKFILKVSFFSSCYNLVCLKNIFSF